MLAFEPVKEHKLENLCNELLTAGIIKESATALFSGYKTRRQ